MNRDYPLFKLTIHPNTDDFAMRAVQHSANGWTLDSWQVLWPEGGHPAVAVMWKKNRNVTEQVGTRTWTDGRTEPILVERETDARP